MATNVQTKDDMLEGLQPEMALFGMVWLLGLKAELRRLEALQDTQLAQPPIYTVPPPPSPYCRLHGYRNQAPPTKELMVSIAPFNTFASANANSRIQL
ncbi:hypothetical protein O3M35_009844 [Rhynocoris fuscipes]|uniref:Uncharacterized protein n=1 Tax=Rhynocoris fuscipes TaxID=488301 RepID=A0AAW1DAB0_9HEMI